MDTKPIFHFEPAIKSFARKKRAVKKLIRMRIGSGVVLHCLLICVVVYNCGADKAGENKSVQVKDDEFIGRMIEEGRTMVHHAVKRFMIILPAIFFKLGVAFSLLVLIAIAAVNNGFIGFMLLVVGLSSVLARLQDSKKHALPYYLPPVHHHAAYHGWDRSDKLEGKEEKPTTYPAYTPQYVYTYNPAYYGQQKV